MPELNPIAQALAPAGHAMLSPSAAIRWMHCPGSVALEEALALPDTSGEAADYGSATHHLSAVCLANVQNAADHVGRKVIMWTHPESESSGCGFEDELVKDGVPNDPCLEFGREFEVDADMAGLSQVYLDVVRSMAEGGQLFVEQQVGISHLTDEPGAYGTSDAIIVHGDTLTVIDLKTGHVEVGAEGNEQLQIYALAALKALEDGLLKIEGVAAPAAPADDLDGLL